MARIRRMVLIIYAGCFALAPNVRIVSVSVQGVHAIHAAIQLSCIHSSHFAPFHRLGPTHSTIYLRATTKFMNYSESFAALRMWLGASCAHTHVLEPHTSDLIIAPIAFSHFVTSPVQSAAPFRSRACAVAALI